MGRGLHSGCRGQMRGHQSHDPVISRSRSQPWLKHPVGFPFLPNVLQAPYRKDKVFPCLHGPTHYQHTGVGKGTPSANGPREAQGGEKRMQMPLRIENHWHECQLVCHRETQWPRSMPWWTPSSTLYYPPRVPWISHLAFWGVWKCPPS